MLVSCLDKSNSSGSAGSNNADALSALNSKLNAKYGSLKTDITIPDVPTILGELPNGSQVIISQPNFIEGRNASLYASISLTDATVTNNTDNYTVSFSTSPVITSTETESMFKDAALPSVYVSDCNLMTGKTCPVVINSNNAPLGAYYITPIFTNITNGNITHGEAFSYTIVADDVRGHHEDGKLMIMLNSTNIAELGQSISGFVGLTDSHNVESLEVEIYPTNTTESDIAEILPPKTCVISSSKGCPIYIKGLKDGVTSFSVRPVQSDIRYDKYKAAKSPDIEVHTPIVPGYLSVKVTPSDLNPHGYGSVVVALESSDNVKDKVVEFASENPGVASVSPACQIPGSSDGTNTCEVVLHSESQSGHTAILAYVSDNSYVPVLHAVSGESATFHGNLEVTLQKPSIWYGQTTHAIVSLVNSSGINGINVNVDSNNLNIATVKEPHTCTLSSVVPTCDVEIMAGSESGISNITATAPSYEQGQTTLNVYPTPTWGTLSISLSSQTISKDADTVANISLNDSLYVHDESIVIGSETASIAAPDGSNICYLSSTNKTCQVRIKGSNVGSTNITVSNKNYITARAPINVIVPGTISLTPDTVDLVYGESTTVTLKLNGSGGINTAKVTLTPDNPGLIKLTECLPTHLSSSVTTCTAKLTASDLTAETKLTATVDADGYLYTESSITVNVTPSILPGHLVVTPSIITQNKSGALKVSLEGSRLVTTPITISPHYNGFINVDRTFCSLNTANPSCLMMSHFRVGDKGTIEFSSPGYAPAVVTVDIQPSPPIESQCSNSTSNVFNTNAPFDGVNVSYQFEPTKLAPGRVSIGYIPFYEFSGGDTLNIAANQNIQPGSQVITDASTTNPVTVGSVTPTVIPGSSANSGEERVTTCGGAETVSQAQLISTVGLTSQGLIHLHMYNSSNGACANWVPQIFDQDLPIGGGYEKTVYYQQQTGCGNIFDKWYIGGTVTIKGNSCPSDAVNCSIFVTLNAIHGGEAKQCNHSRAKSYALFFNRPELFSKLSNLSNFHLQTINPSFVGYGDQSLTVSMNNANVPIGQPPITCPVGDWCTSANAPNLWYTNGWSGNRTMSYSALLRHGEPFRQACVGFNPY